MRPHRVLMGRAVSDDDWVENSLVRFAGVEPSSDSIVLAAAKTNADAFDALDRGHPPGVRDVRWVALQTAESYV